MALRVKVKVGRINNLSDARYCAGMGIEWIGFNINPDSPNYISPEKFSEIKGWLAGVKLIGEFGSASAKTILLQAEKYELDGIEISRDEIVQDLFLNLPIFLNINMENTDNLIRIMSTNKDNVDYFLLQSKDEKKQDLAIDLASQFPIILGFGISKNSLEHLLRQNFAGFSISDNNDSKSGFKDLDQLASILEALEIED